MNALFPALFESFFSSSRLQTVLRGLAKQLGEHSGASRVFVALSPGVGLQHCRAVEWTNTEHPSDDPENSLAVLEALQSVIDGATESNFQLLTPPFDLPTESQRTLENWQIDSVLALPCRREGQSLVDVFLLTERGTPLACEFADLESLESLLDLLGRGVFHAVTSEVLAISESFHRELLDGGDVALVQLSAQGVIEYASAGFERLTGLSFHSIRGRFYREVVGDLVPIQERKEVLRRLRALVSSESVSEVATFAIRPVNANREVRVVERAVITGDGDERHFRLSLVPISDAQGRGDLGAESLDARYKRLVEHSDAVIFHTDAEHIITFISRRALDFFGVAPEDFQNQVRSPWFEYVHSDDIERVRSRVFEMHRARSSFDEECRVINRVTGRMRWLLIRLVPVRRPDGEIEGWDGFGIDITSRRDAQEALEGQSRKIRALYAVSAAVRGDLDPARLAMRGLTALCDATGGDAGVCFLSSDVTNAPLKLLAHVGLSESPNTANAELFQKLESLAVRTMTKGQSVVIPDIRTDSLTAPGLGDEDLFSSTVFVPVLAEDEVIGAVGLLSRKRVKFDGGAIMLISAAANQVGLAARQAGLFALSQRQAKTLAALYLMSHELSRGLSLDEIFQRAFAITRDKLGLERLWLGLVSEGGTRIVGQAAYGPGWRRRLVNLNVDISGDHPLAEVVRSKSVLVLHEPEQSLKDFPLRRVFVRMGVETIVLVPLIAGGQVHGVLGVQPGNPHQRLREEEIALLSSLANEIASVLLTKRLEERIAQSERMRTLGVLAGGISHNFNNVYQAILGQASLLELQKKDPAKVERAAALITEAAMKGAGLVRQLLTFSQLEEPRRESCDVVDILGRNRSLLEQLMTPAHQLVFPQSKELPKAFVDPGQIVQVVTSLVANAVDAMPNGGAVEIDADTVDVDGRVRTNELAPGRYVRLFVRDHGHGMDVETQRRCFEPFFSTKDLDQRSGLSLSGAGLSLAAAYALVRRNGGTLTFESSEGIGTVFFVLLPIAGSAVEEGFSQEESTVAVSSVPKLAAMVELEANGSRLPETALNEADSPSPKSVKRRANAGSSRRRMPEEKS